MRLSFWTMRGEDVSRRRVRSRTTTGRRTAHRRTSTTGSTRTAFDDSARPHHARRPPDSSVPPGLGPRAGPHPRLAVGGRDTTGFPLGRPTHGQPQCLRWTLSRSQECEARAGPRVHLLVHRRASAVGAAVATDVVALTVSSLPALALRNSSALPGPRRPEGHQGGLGLGARTQVRTVGRTSVGSHRCIRTSKGRDSGNRRARSLPDRNLSTVVSCTTRWRCWY